MFLDVKREVGNSFVTVIYLEDMKEEDLQVEEIFNSNVQSLFILVSKLPCSPTMYKIKTQVSLEYEYLFEDKVYKGLFNKEIVCHSAALADTLSSLCFNANYLLRKNRKMITQMNWLRKTYLDKLQAVYLSDAIQKIKCNLLLNLCFAN